VPFSALQKSDFSAGVFSSNTFYSVLFGTFYGVVFTIYTIYVLTAAEAYGLFSRGVKFNFNYKKKKKVS
jgi:hypothetical protein